jgi:2-keto-4-pentenoate hydratase/2-oxohepta-3-ene-1,7-dioic acid hydratase in catechol pathway
MGPYLVTADKERDPHRLQVRLWVNETLATVSRPRNFGRRDLSGNLGKGLRLI